MQHVVTIASLLVFAWVNYRLGFNKGFRDGFRDGYEKGANKVVDEWRTWLDKIEEE